MSAALRLLLPGPTPLPDSRCRPPPPFLVDLRRRPVAQRLVPPLLIVEGEVHREPRLQQGHGLVPLQVQLLMLDRAVISRHSVWALSRYHFSFSPAGRA